MTDIKTDFVDNVGQTVDAAYLNGLGGAVNANTNARPLVDAFANRPAAAATNSGALYFCTDCDAVYRSNGSAWSKIRIGAAAGPPMADPPSSGLTTTAMGSDAFSSDLDGRKLTLATSGSGWRVEYKALTPTSNYTATAYIETTLGANLFTSGLVLLASNGTTLIVFGPSFDTNASVAVRSTTALNTVSSSPASIDARGLPKLPNWYRIRDDGTNNNFEYSTNGVDWRSAYSASRTAILTPASIGWGGFNNSGSASAVVRLRSLVVASN